MSNLRFFPAASRPPVREVDSRAVVRFMQSERRSVPSLSRLAIEAAAFVTLVSAAVWLVFAIGGR